MKLSIFLTIYIQNIMNVEMVLVGAILFSAMIACGIKIWLIKRKEQKSDESEIDVEYDSTT